MARNTTTLAQLIERVRQRADMVESSFVSDAEITGFINIAISELHDAIVLSYEDYYVSKSDDITLPLSADANDDLDITDTGLSLQEIAPNFYKALGVDFNLAGITFRLKPYMFSERNAYANPFYINTALPNVFYKIQDGRINFIPASTISGTATLWYVPEAKTFDSDDTTEQILDVEPRLRVGWEEYVILDGAIKCLMKEESDVKLLVQMKGAQIDRIFRALQNKDAGEPLRISDVSTGTLQSDFIHWFS
jgi:hypothetical protein